jgi:methionyl aminopeptidase
LAGVFKRLRKVIKPGLRTDEIDEFARKLVLAAGAKPAFLGYMPPGGGKKYPASICISVNDEIVHGVPSGRLLNEGDIVSLDFGVLQEDFYSDGAITLPVGTISRDAARLMDATEKALYLGIDASRAGNTTGDIGFAVQSYVEAQGFAVVRDLVGHGVGRDLHEEPQIPNYGRRGEGIRLREGMVIAIEPMVTSGSWAIKLADDGWTYKTADGSLAAHFEHTVAITKKGPKILTR